MNAKIEYCPDCGREMDFHGMGCPYESMQPLREKIKQLEAELKKPECKTCGDSGSINKPDIVDSVGVKHIGEFVDCPDCKKPEAGELSKKVKSLLDDCKYGRITNVEGSNAMIPLLHEALAELEKYRWIPVSERLPEDDSSAYLFLHDSGNVHQGTPSCDLFGPDGKLWHSITHWKPITLPPKEKQ